MIATTQRIALAAMATVALHAAPATAKDQASFVFTPLAPPDAANSAILTGVYQDQAIGWYNTANDGPQGFVWSAGRYTPIPQLGIVDAVSDSGVAIGNTPGSDTSYTTYDVTTGSTTIVNFAPPGGIGFSIGGINSSGAIAATQYTAVMKRKPKTACEPFEQGADGSYTWLAQSHLSGLGSVGLTDDGRVVMGRSLQCEGTGAADYFSYENGKKKKITFPGMSSLGVYFVTGSGFGGYFYTADNQQEFGFASTDRRKITTYATPPGSTAIVVTAIGPKNKVAGYAIAPSGYFHGFIYVGKSYHSIDYPNQKSTIITGFSSTGAIIGYFGDGKAINGYPKQPFIATCASDKGCTQ